MKHMKYLTVVLIAVALSCTQEEPDTQIKPNEPKADPKDENAMIIGMGRFIDSNAGHNLSGKVLLLKDAQNKVTLRFEDFSVINGPDVNVYLSKTPSYKDVIDLGDLKANSGNVNYELNSSINTTEYKYVLIWCVKFAVLFGYAEVAK